MIGESILQLHEGNAVDESIKSYEYDEYQPITGTQLNSAGQITITVENQGQFLHRHNSYLLVEGDVLKADNTRYADADLALAKNGLAHLLSSLNWPNRWWNMSTISVRLHHFSVWRPTHQTIQNDVDCYRAGLQALMLMQPLLIPDLQYANAS